MRGDMFGVVCASSSPMVCWSFWVTGAVLNLEYMLRGHASQSSGEADKAGIRLAGLGLGIHGC